MKTILDELRQFFASQMKGAVLLTTLPDDYPAYAIRLPEGFGVAVLWDGEATVSEHFANAHFGSKAMLLAGEEKKFLLLTSYREELRNEFACVCAQFVDPGLDGADRKALLGNPLSWWKDWKTLLGNVISDKAPYSIMCELLALEHVRTFDPEAEWTATKSGTHDIESPTHGYEVKSTIRRYGADVTISGQFQLLAPKPLDLYFCRVEESPSGISINDMVGRLVASGYDEGLLEHQLATQGYEQGASSRDKAYSILERRMYHVDDSFPKITENSFKGDVFPHGVKQITYTVDLETVEHLPW